MATFYSDWAYRGDGYGQRLILDISRDGATVWFNLKLESNGAMYATANYSWGGRVSGEGSVQVSKSHAFVQSISSGSFVENNAFSTFATATMFWGGQLQVDASLPAHVNLPGVPTNYRFEQSTADLEAGRGTLKWTPGVGSTFTRLALSVNGGSYHTIGYPTGNSFPVHSMMPDSYYYFTAVAGNTAGESAGVFIGTGQTLTPFWTKPSAPSNVRAYVRSSTSATVAYKLNAQYKYGLEIESSNNQKWTFGNGTYGELGEQQTVSITASTGVKFRVRSYLGPSSRKVFSEWSAWSAPVATLAVPNAPINVTPNGGVYSNAPANNLRVSWRHNPADGTPQTRWRIRYKNASSTTWSSPLEYTSSAQAVTLHHDAWNPIRALGNPEIQISTMGGLSGAWSPWSASSTFQLVPQPNVTLVKPGATVHTNRITMQWNTSSSLAQTAYEAQLWKGSVLLEERRGESAATSVTFNHKLENNTQYRVSLRTRVAAEVWSSVVSRNVNIQFIPPTPPEVLSSKFHGEVGAVSLQVGMGDVLNNAYVRVERSVDGGETYWHMEDREHSVFELQDFQCKVNGITKYRLTAVSPEGAESSVIHDVSSVSTPEAPSLALGKCGAYLSTGHSFENVLAFPYKIERSRTTSRQRATFSYNGRAHPVPYIGQGLSDVFSITGLLKTGQYAEGTTEAELAELLRQPFAIYLWRDPDGNHVYCSVGEITFEKTSNNITTWSVELTRVAYEGGGNLAGVQ